MEAKVIELQEFVSQTLVQIIKGVRQAQIEIGGTGGEISPTIDNLNSNNTNLIGWKKSGIFVESVISPAEFDLALTTTIGDGTKAGIGVFSGLFGAGMQSEMSNSNVQLSRIKFSVPIMLPIHHAKYPSRES
jgi:hypothetical protein